MRRRSARLLLPVVAVVLLVVALPAAASAKGPWVVKNASGKEVGRLVPLDGTPRGFGNVYNRVGKQLGDVADEDGYWLIWVNSGIDAGLWKSGPKSWSVGIPYASRTSLGRAKLVGSHWVLQRKISGAWRRKGSVAKACPGQLAAGGLRLLLW